jgi:cyclopropane fatty-acyl-phospholipid synthase-like methyltransferase
MKYAVLLAIAVAFGACSSSKSAEKHDGEHAHKQGEHGEHGHGAHEHRFDEPEKYAKRWNDPARAEWQKPNEVIALMELEPGMTAVDLGAGTGYFVPYLAAAVAPDGKVLALDVEQAMIDWLDKQKTEKGWSFVETRKVAFDDPMLEKQSVDRMLTVNVWHHISDRKNYAQKLASALKSGGMVVVVDYEPEWKGGGPPPEMRLKSAEIEADFAAAGLQTELAEESLPRQYIVVARKP